MMKKQIRLISVFVAMLMLLSVFFVQVSANSPGDLDNDGYISAADSRLALRTAVGLETLDAEQAYAADVLKESASKSIVNSMDAREILRIAVGLSYSGYKNVTFNEITDNYSGNIKLFAQEKDGVVSVAVVGNKLTQANAYDLTLSFNGSELEYSALDNKNSDIAFFYMRGQASVLINPVENGKVAVSGYFLEDFTYTTDYSDIIDDVYMLSDEKVLFFVEFKPLSGELAEYDFSLEGKLYVNEDSFVTVESSCSFVPEEDVTEEPTSPHTHSFSNEVIVAPGCTTVGEMEFTCACGEIYRGIIPATGHADEDADGICDICGEGEASDENDNEQPVEKSFFEKIADFFARIVEFFRNLFNF